MSSIIQLIDFNKIEYRKKGDMLAKENFQPSTIFVAYMPPMAHVGKMYRSHTYKLSRAFKDAHSGYAEVCGYMNAKLGDCNIFHDSDKNCSVAFLTVREGWREPIIVKAMEQACNSLVEKANRNRTYETIIAGVPSSIPAGKTWYRDYLSTVARCLARYDRRVIMYSPELNLEKIFRRGRYR